MRNIFEKDALTKLAVRAKNGDLLAAEKLYEELFDKVFGFCMNRTSNRTVAEDLTQDIFLKLVDKINTFDEAKGNFLVWFWQLARNTLTDHYRKAKDINFSEIEEEKMEKITPIVHPERVEYKIEFDRVKSFVDTLSAEERELFELHFVADMRYKDISALTKKSEGSLRVAVNRLKEKVKKNLK